MLSTIRCFSLFRLYAGFLAGRGATGGVQGYQFFPGVKQDPETCIRRC
jgi:hypothetical protein